MRARSPDRGTHHSWLAMALVMSLQIGCSQLYGLHDVPVDVEESGGDGAPACFGTLAEVCLDRTSVAAWLAIAGSIDTSTDARCKVIAQPQNTELCVIAADTLVITGDARVRGGRVLVLLATSTLSIEATLNGSSTRGGAAGPAAGDCASLAGSEGSTTTGGGGGGGGSFGGPGGQGGLGYLGGAGGGVAPTLVAARLRGGCAGGLGGAGTGVAAAGGAGGGALYLLAGTQLAMSATGAVFAGGAGGEGARSRGGGGGGGSGGLIALEAPVIEIRGMVAANGGGGGEGAGVSTPGNDGEDGLESRLPAHGGANGTTRGGDGGDGAAGATLAGTDGSPGAYLNLDGGGGGGGGGGAGMIWIKGVVIGVAPPTT
jgi:hypothetical protein